jgi:antitoxin CptB
MNDPLDIRRRKLRYRSRRRGTKELDLLLGGFAEQFLDSMDRALLDGYERFLLESDPDLEDWLAGRADPPSDLDPRLRDMVRGYRYRPVAAG